MYVRLRARIVSIAHQCRLQNPFLLLQLRNVPYRGNITKHALPSLFMELNVIKGMLRRRDAGGVRRLRW
ncbi:hypothetical protein ALC62_12457 [Cyphomyrmex costatus]|uniref:Uncharacterized protein n=1 Tax=Cyphomyrmex costatus TaxID=456900 RepID=A0A151IB81_9HYME|nr:hypothetical protein ALC62_12457 [Cyphomyrmex costatus]